MYNRAANAYRTVSLTSASPSQVLDEVFVRLWRDLDDAERGMRCGNVGAKAKALSHAVALVEALASSLDPSVDAALTKRLAGLYEFAATRLFHANVHSDPAALAEVRRVLQPVHQAFRAAAEAT